MGFNGVYIAIDDPSLEALWALEGQRFRDRFLEIEEDATFKRLDIGKSWDILHCTLTSVSASTPIEGDKRSEAIVGVHVKLFDDDDSMFVSVIDHTEIEGVLVALREFDEEKLTASFSAATLREQRVYPAGIWKEDKTALVAEMDSTLRAIRKFLRTSFNDGRHVLATIL